ncbi:GAF domain-containing SpoIIE family protein phosphatase [Jatrophihabitans fulvus]
MTATETPPARGTDTVSESAPLAPAEALPEATPLPGAPDGAFDRFAALVREALQVPVALVSLVDRQGQVFPGAVGLPSPWNGIRRTPLSHSFCQYVVASDEPLVVRDARTDPRVAGNLAITEIGVVAYAGVPLRDIGDRVVGSLCAIDDNPRDWTPRELHLLTELAAACSAELRLRSTAALARRAGSRATALLELSETFMLTDSVEDVSRAVQYLATAHLDAVHGAVAVVDRERELLHYVTRPDAVESPDAGSTPWASTFPLPLESPSTEVARTGIPQLYETLDALAGVYPVTSERVARAGGQASVFYPLHVAGQVIGTVAVLWPTERRFDADDRTLLAALGRYTAQAAHRALLLADRRRVANMLQLSMLPALPETDWVRLATRYVPASAADAVGGDWYDAFVRPDGRLCVSVGDVQGHDVEAASVMGRLSSMIRGVALAHPGTPADVLVAVDSALEAAPLGRYGTTVLATVDPPTHRAPAVLTWANAGHPPPLVITADGVASFLEVRPHRPPVGLGLRPAREAHRHELPAGCTLLLFTDGLVERPGRDLDARLALLAGLAADNRHRPLAELIDVLVQRMQADHGEERRDDVLVMGLRVPVSAPA